MGCYYCLYCIHLMKSVIRMIDFPFLIKKGNNTQLIPMIADKIM